MKKILLLTAVTLFALASCDLAEEPVTSLDNEKALANFAGLDGATALTYAGLRAETWYGLTTSLMPDVMCGNAVAGTPMNTGRGFNYNIWNFTAANGGIGVYNAAYATILRCNNVIHKIKTDRATYLAEAGVKDENLNNIMAECLFMRAYAYFDLVRWYAKPYAVAKNATGVAAFGVPVVSEDPDVSVVEKPKRQNTVKNYELIVADLTEALRLMDRNYHRSGVLDAKAACSYHVIEALLARVYLFMEDYENAEKMATNVITSGKYQLATAADYVSIWSEPSWTNIGEIIFCAYVDKTEGSINNAPGNCTDPNQYGDVRASADLTNLFDANDIRFTMLKTSAEHQGYYWPAKYEGKGDGMVQYSSIPLIRLSEMYLIRSEARYHLGKDGLADLNMIATNRNAPAYDAVTADHLFDENRKEFAFEGHIYHDYKRLGRSLTRVDVASQINKDLDADNKLWLMPIATSELDVNDNLEQNPGY